MLRLHYSVSLLDPTARQINTLLRELNEPFIQLPQNIIHCRNSVKKMKSASLRSLVMQYK